MAETCSQSDLVARRRSWWFLWGLPMAAIVLAPTLSNSLAFIWTPAFLLMGGACAYNARTCGRLHCFLTAPLFLLAGTLSLLNGLGLTTAPWGWIGGGVVLGTVLAHTPEWIRGKYVSDVPPREPT